MRRQRHLSNSVTRFKHTYLAGPAYKPGEGLRVGDGPLRLVTFTDIAKIERLHATILGYFTCTKPCVRCHGDKAETYYALPVFGLGVGPITLLIPEQGLAADVYATIGATVARHALGGMLLASTYATRESMETLSRRLGREDWLELSNLAAYWAGKRPRAGKRVRIQKALAGAH